jgi:putative sterol carrier protein/NAD-dependent dihydropyrimidine dehydrogenase PreA subunit
LSIPLAIQAGLGEISRLGLLITPEYGPRVRLCKVYTDLPLQPDQPITFGVVEFCKTCLKCADACPARCISRDPEPSFKTVGFSNNPGVKKWYNRLEPCAKYWTYKVDCSACVASCPYNKPNNWIHQIGLRVAQTPVKGILRQVDDLLGYGKTFDQKAMTHWWSSRPNTKPEVAGSSIEKVNADDRIEITESSTPQDLFSAIYNRLQQQPERLIGINAVFQFHLTGDKGGHNFISVHGGCAEVGEGQRPDADCTFTLTDTDFLLMMSHKLSPQKAILSGRMRFQGEMSTAIKIRKIII